MAPFKKLIMFTITLKVFSAYLLNMKRITVNVINVF